MKHFHYPLTHEHLAEIAHPRKDHLFSRPWKHRGNVAVSNGYLSLIVQTFLDCDRESRAASAYLDRLPWSKWDYLSETPPERWGDLDTRRGGLWSHGEKPLWSTLTNPDKPTPILSELVIVGHPWNIVPVPVLQLISKLPRPELYLDTTEAGVLAVRFNGGFGFAHIIPRDTLPKIPRYHLWKNNPNPIRTGF